MEDRNETLEELNDILEKTYDSIAGFKQAAENTNDSHLLNYFNEQVNTRSRFADELVAEVRNLGGTPKTEGTVQGAMHRTWIDFKTMLSFNDEESILEACITGEKNCLSEYNDLLEEAHVPESTRSLLNKQKSEVLNSISKLESEEELHDD